MIFIVSNETTFVTATSYLSVARADEIIGASSSGSDWTGKTDAIKQILLNQSSSIVDGMASYKGSRTDSDQLLKFPRGESKTIPVGIQYATAALAVKFASGAAFASGATGEIKSEKAGEFSTTYFPTTGASSVVKDNVEARGFLAGLIAKQMKIVA